MRKQRRWIVRRKEKSPSDGLVPNRRISQRTSGEWLQTTCEKFADEHPEWDITFVYGVADEATAAGQVAQDPEASADVFMYANDTLTTMTDANALVKFGGKYREEIERQIPKKSSHPMTKNGELYGVPFTTNTWLCTRQERYLTKRT